VNFSSFSIRAAALFLCTALCAEDQPQQLPSKDFTTFIYTTFLYWKYTTPNLVFGRDGVGLTNAIPENEVAVTKTGRSFLPHFHYNPGYQVGGGFRFGAKRVFDLTSLYTWMFAHPKRVVEADEISPSFLPINWLTSNSLESASYQRASLEMRANCHYPEVQFGYNFIINSHLNLRPYTALASIIVAGDLKTHYQFTPPGGIKAAARRHGKSFAWSLGPKLGLDFVVLPWKDWGLFSNVNFTHQAVQLKMKTISCAASRLSA
jgi:hypothetical protein